MPFADFDLVFLRNSMIHIKVECPDKETAVIWVDGNLDRQSLSSLQKICRDHIWQNNQILLHVDGLHHVSEEGKNFLREIRDKVTLVGLSEFLKLEIC